MRRLMFQLELRTDGVLIGRMGAGGSKIGPKRLFLESIVDVIESHSHCLHAECTVYWG